MSRYVEEFALRSPGIRGSLSVGAWEASGRLDGSRSSVLQRQKWFMLSRVATEPRIEYAGQDCPYPLRLSLSA